MESEVSHCPTIPKPTGSLFGFSYKTIVVFLFALLYCTSFYYAAQVFFKQTYSKEFQADDYLNRNDFNAPGYSPLIPTALNYVGNDVLFLISLLTLANIMLLYYISRSSWSVLLYTLGGVIAHSAILGSGLLAQTTINTELLLLLAFPTNPLRLLLIPLAFLTHKFGFYLITAVVFLTFVPTKHYAHLIAIPLWMKNTLSLPLHYSNQLTFNSFALFPLAIIVPFTFYLAPILIQQTLVLTLIGSLVTYGFNNRAFFTVLPLLVLCITPALKANRKQESWVMLALIIWYAIGVLVFLTRIGATALE